VSTRAGRSGTTNDRSATWLVACLWALCPCLPCAPASGGTLPTTIDDFFHPGSQPNGEVVYDTFRSSATCRFCHEADGTGTAAIFERWQGSMMAQSARDPIFFASLAIANQDAAFAGDVCIRCHSPGGWLSGRSSPTDGSALVALDRDGVSCTVCHRMVDPVFTPGVSPPSDEFILDNLTSAPIGLGSGNYVMDPIDDRRGPYDDVINPNHTWLPSPFHKTSELCGTCHDVSNPAFQRQPDGTYVPNLLGRRHGTGRQYDMFPLERTYSEWKNSAFVSSGIDMGGRFGGTNTVVSTCQDCHMPQTTGVGGFGAAARDDLAVHELVGGNTWAQQMVLNLYPTDGLVEQNLIDGMAAARSMLQRACTLEVTQVGNGINVRIVNETGHKLPTGYPEGRRMWINVALLDESLAPVREYGAYDAVSADLSTADTKVYETVLGVDETMSGLTGLPVGRSFHFALANTILKDNRIPPRGFENEAFAAAQANPVGVAYADGQYWDDTRFRLVDGTTTAVVRVYYQTSSKEFITFLRDTNHSNEAGNVLYDQWELTGKSPPVLMAEATLVIAPFPRGDVNGDGAVDTLDYASVPVCQTSPGAGVIAGGCTELDYDVDDDVDLRDVAEFQLAVGG